ncbi:hypothetical protein RA279_27970, partial [Pseudomonas syringae pv. tagetis]|uniref:hypothetical protein n=1 Tax=Pseudomonas syringae group genomosp. 7 TaxID=251699 RepID=UPI00376F7EF3
FLGCFSFGGGVFALPVWAWAARCCCFLCGGLWGLGVFGGWLGCGLWWWWFGFFWVCCLLWGFLWCCWGVVGGVVVVGGLVGCVGCLWGGCACWVWVCGCFCVGCGGLFSGLRVGCGSVWVCE